VYRWEETTLDFVLVGTALDLRQPCFAESGLPNGKSSLYAVSAFNSAGESLRSEEIRSVSSDRFPAPSNFSVYNGDQHIGIEWDPVPGATSYIVRRSPGGVILAERTTADYDESGLTNGTSYTYVVSARNSDGESRDSQIVTAVPQYVPVSCGLTGLEGTVLLAMLALSRRKRRD
jgi:cellulose 1,4-beta-cellobiosidase